MKIIQAGYPNSGNYWLYRILYELKKAAGIKPSSFITSDPIYQLAKEWELISKEQAEMDTLDILNEGCFYRISTRYRNKIDDLDDYINKTNHVITYSNFSPRSKDVFTHFDKIIYIIRDPRDVAVATSKLAYTPYMQKNYPTRHENEAEYLEKELINICKSWTKHVFQYLESDLNIHYVFYERLLFDLDNELKSLIEYLELDIASSKKLAIKNLLATNMAAEFNNNGVKPKLYTWKFKLSSWQKALCLNSSKTLLHYLNYPLNNDDESLPAFMSALNPNTINNLKRQLERRSLNQMIKIFQEAFK